MSWDKGSWGPSIPSGTMLKIEFLLMSGSWVKNGSSLHSARPTYLTQVTGGQMRNADVLACCAAPFRPYTACPCPASNPKSQRSNRDISGVMDGGVNTSEAMRITIPLCTVDSRCDMAAVFAPRRKWRLPVIRGNGHQGWFMLPGKPAEDSTPSMLLEG